MSLCDVLQLPSVSTHVGIPGDLRVLTGKVLNSTYYFFFFQGVVFSSRTVFFHHFENFFITASTKCWYFITLRRYEKAHGGTKKPFPFQHEWKKELIFPFVFHNFQPAGNLSLVTNMMILLTSINRIGMEHH